MQFKTSIARALAFALGSLTGLGAAHGDGGIYPDNLVAGGGYPGGPYAEGGYSGGGYAGGGYVGGAYAGGGYAGGGYAVGSDADRWSRSPASRRDLEGSDRRIAQPRDQQDELLDRPDRVIDRRHDQLERREEERVKREERQREPRVHLRARERFDDRVQRRARGVTPFMRAPRPNQSQEPRHNENSAERRGQAPGVDRD